MTRRTFPKRVYRAILRRQRMVCAACPDRLTRGNIHFDHEKPLWLGGEDTPENLRAIHVRPCHARKTADEAGRRAKVKRIQARENGTRRPRAKIHNRGFDKSLKRKVDGTVEPRGAA